MLLVVQLVVSVLMDSDGSRMPVDVAVVKTIHVVPLLQQDESGDFM